MEKSKEQSLQIKQLRLWNKNPRYTEYSDIKINNIGVSDFKINLDGWIEEDLYNLDTVINIIYKFINTFEKAMSMFDLVESMLNGFESGIDEILVIKPESILDMSEGQWTYLKEIYYVVEGNRRLAAILLILNENNEREKLLKDINDEEIKNEVNKIFEICKKYDNYNHRPFLKSIPCRILNYSFYITEEGIRFLNKILNAKHFGNRKGKLNWPRGLMLKKIFNYCKKYLLITNSNKKNIKLDNLCKYIEDRIGKKINSHDITTAIFVSEFIRIWNENNSNNKIELHDTEPGDISQSDDIIYDDASVDKKVKFSVSSLELCRTKIKILNQKYEQVSLSKILKFDYIWNDLKLFGLNIIFIEKDTPLEHSQIVELVNIIVDGVIKKKITTREVKPEIGEKIRTILYKTDQLTFDKALNLSLKDLCILSIPEKTTNKIILTILKNVNKLIDYAQKIIDLKLNNDNNVFIKTINYIWRIEYLRLIKLKSTLVLKDLPILIFSGLLRSTVEFICSIILKEMLLDYLKNYDRWKNNNDLKNKNYSSLCKDFFENSISISNKSLIGSFLLNNINLDLKFDDSNIEERRIIIEDLKIFLNIWIGIYDYDWINDLKSNIFDLNKLSETKKLVHNNQFNGNKIFKDNLKESFEEYIVPVISLNNFYNIFSDNKKIKSIIYIINKTVIDNDLEINNPSDSVWKSMNIFIHKPCYSMWSYINQEKFTEILTLFVELEKEILNIID